MLPLQVLRDAGPGGAGLQELIDGLAGRGVKTWPEARIAKSSIASTCGHDPAFVRIGAGVFALRAVTHLPEVHPPCISATHDSHMAAADLMQPVSCHTAHFDIQQQVPVSSVSGV